MYPSRIREAVLLLPPAMMLIMGASLYYRLAPSPANKHLLIGAILLASLFYLVHLQLRSLGQDADQILFPAIAMLTCLGLIFLFHIDPHLAVRQFTWVLLGLGGMSGVLFMIKDYHWLAEYKYTFILLGLAFLILTVLLGDESGGSRNWLSLGQFRFQPAELVKFLVVVFMAAYLTDYKELLAKAPLLGNPFSLSVRGLGPLVVVGGLLLFLLVVQKDLGAALIFFTLLLSMVYIASGRLPLIIIGLFLFSGAAWLSYYLFPHVRTRVAIWHDPWPWAEGAGYQLIQSFFALAQGGLTGMGLGMSSPSYIPAVGTDFIFSVAGGELGFVGGALILFIYFVITWQGFKIAAAAPDDFGLLLAAGLVLLFSIQTLVIVGGVLKIFPLTGVTLPFMSYGGSSIVLNYLMFGLLLKLSSLFRLPAGQVGHEH